MTANASDYRDQPTRADLQRQCDVLYGFVVELLVAQNAYRYGRALTTLRPSEKRALVADVAPKVWGRVCADTDETARWIEIARGTDRGGIPS